MTTCVCTYLHLHTHVFLYIFSSYSHVLCSALSCGRCQMVNTYIERYIFNNYEMTRECGDCTEEEGGQKGMYIENYAKAALQRVR